MIKFNLDWPRKNLSESLLSSVLQTQRLLIKAPESADYPLWFAVRKNNEKFLKPYEPEWPKDCLSKSFFERRLKRQAEERSAGRGAFFLIHHKVTGNIIGGVNLNNIQMGAAHHATLGYWIDENHQGKGYMRESVHCLIDYSFETLKLRRLNAACLIDNDRSINMLLRLGFEEEGYAKKYLQINGHWQDHRLFGLCCNT